MKDIFTASQFSAVKFTSWVSSGKVDWEENTLLYLLNNVTIYAIYIFDNESLHIYVFCNWIKA